MLLHVKVACNNCQSPHLQGDLYEQTTMIQNIAFVTSLSLPLAYILTGALLENWYITVFCNAVFTKHSSSLWNQNEYKDFEKKTPMHTFSGLPLFEFLNNLCKTMTLSSPLPPSLFLSPSPFVIVVIVCKHCWDPFYIVTYLLNKQQLFDVELFHNCFY